MRMRIRTFRFLGGMSTQSKTRGGLLRFMDSVTAAVGGSNDGDGPDGFLWSPSTALTYLGSSLCWSRNLSYLVEESQA